MDFGTIFISLIAFTIAALAFPVYIAENLQRNIDLLRKSLQRERAIGEINTTASVSEQANGLWDFLVRQERAHKIHWIRKQIHIPPIMGMLVLEVLIFAIAAHKIARGGRMPGVIEDVVVFLSYFLIAVSVYIAYRAIEGHLYFKKYLRAFEEYTALFDAHKTPRQKE